MRKHAIVSVLSLIPAIVAVPALAQDGAADNVTAVEEDNGRYYTADGIPTFNVSEDGTVDWLTFSGYRRYHAECHTCHGPDGEGSSYAPPIKDSAVNMDYYDFVATVTNGRENVGASNQNVMPAFGTNPNVMCFLDDIYVYLKARGAGAIPRGRPGAKEAKSEMIDQDTKACLGI